MANPVCSLTTLVTNAACYNQAYISPATKQALLLYAKVLELAAIGGTDYSAVLVTTLATDASTLFNDGITYDQLAAAQIALAFANATAAGASVPDTIDLKLDAIKCLAIENPLLMAKMDVLLNCALGRGKSYPQ